MATVSGGGGRAHTDAVTSRDLDREAPARYLNCPRCRLSIRPGALSLHIVHCPRCVARSRAVVEMFVSTLPADQLYGDGGRVRYAARAPASQAPGSGDDGSEDD